MNVTSVRAVTWFKSVIYIVVIATIGFCFPSVIAYAQISGYEQLTNRVLVPASSFANVNVACSSGNKVLGGGFDIETPDFVKVFSSEPSDGAGNISDHNWNVLVQNIDPEKDRQVTVSAICASASPAPAGASAVAVADRYGARRNAHASRPRTRHAESRGPVAVSELMLPTGRPVPKRLR